MSRYWVIIGNPTPADFPGNPEADIFYFGGVVYGKDIRYFMMVEG